MRCPDYSQLPAPREGCLNWPWREAFPKKTSAITFPADHWPRVSIITPSYNQANYLEETIRSVLLQGYPDLEYILIDGGSSDGSQEIIRKYSPWIEYWCSEPDEGQSHAINKGLQHATGEIVAWLNSDDTFEPDTVFQGVRSLLGHPEAVLAYGHCWLIDETGRRKSNWKTKPTDRASLLLEGNDIPQQTVFMKRNYLDRVGGLNQSLNYIMDYELWLRLGEFGPFAWSGDIASNLRLHSESKSVARSECFWVEHFELLERLPQIQQILPSEKILETRRRWQVKACLEYLFHGQDQAAFQHLEQSLSVDGYPFGSAHLMAQWILDHGNLVGEKICDNPQILENCLDLIKQLSNKTKARRLMRAMKSYLAMQQVFEGHRNQDHKIVRRHIWNGILNDPTWLENRGVWSILIQAYWPAYSK